MLERDIENKLIDWLINQLGYEYVEFTDSFTMEDNIINCLSAINKKALDNRKLGKDELKQIFNILDNESADYGNYAYNFNKRMHNRIRIRNMMFTDKEALDLKLISDSCFDNKFQVAHQIIDKVNSSLKNSNRYDVTLLINGFPLVQIELKNVDTEINAAIEEINGYIKNGFRGVFKYIQLFVVSNDVNTRYYINNNTVVNKKFTFQWARYTVDNDITKTTRLDSLNEFTHDFLDKQNLYEVLTEYIIRYGEDGKQNIEKPMVVMRPYQIYAIRKVLDRLKRQIVNTENNNANGYIFHTTGSGKTLTSWKCAQLAATQKHIDKVIFLVDRRDLDAQTVIEFQSIEGMDVSNTENTKKLLENFKSHTKLIVTTMQKFNNALKLADEDTGKPEYKRVIGAYRDKRVVFIIDECHRTQLGDMHRNIRRFFNYSQYIGFTGTPIFSQNAPLGCKTTKELFGDELHRYSIEDAIRDGSVLAFSIDYHNTIITNKKFKELSDDEKTAAIQANAEEIVHNDERIRNIVNKIYEIHNEKTSHRMYNAIFAVDSINGLLKYYNEFKRHNESLEKEEDRLKVSAIFTTAEGENDGISYKEHLDAIIDDFNKDFNMNCTDEDKFRGELTKKLKVQDNHVDIVIVVGIFLTGFDNKLTSTLYVDKNLEYHGLLQAFSRTNRVEKATKPTGNIVCFRPLKKKVDEAIELFSSEKGGVITITKTYDVCIDNLEKLLDDLLKTVPDDFNISSNEHTDLEKSRFVKTMREFNKALTETKQFTEFTWSVIEDKLSQDNYKKLIGQLKTIHSDLKENNEKESILEYIDFCMDLVEVDRIDTEYIKNLLNNIDVSSKAGLERGVDRINELIDKTTNESLRYKKEIIKKFLEELVVTYESGIIKNATDVRREFRGYVSREKHRGLVNLSKDSGVELEQIKDTFDSYQVIDKIDKGELRELIRSNNPDLGVLERKKKVNLLEKGYKAFKKIFSDLF